MERKNYIRILLLPIFSVCSVFAAKAYDFEVDGIYYDINTDETTVTVVSDMSDKDHMHANPYYWGDVVIPSHVVYNGVEYIVNAIGSFAFCEAYGLTSITIPNTITSVGRYGFFSCRNLKAVFIDNIESWCNIRFSEKNEDYSANPLTYAHHLYLNGEEITHINIPNSITVLGKLVFAGCTGLSSVTIPNSVTYIDDYAFMDCSGLIEVIIPNSVTTIGQCAFSNCSSLSKLSLGNSVQSIGNSAFRDCSGLTEIAIPNSVTSIEAFAFSSCTGLEKVSITDLGAWCNIDFGNSVWYAHRLFLNGSEIHDLQIPSHVKTIKTYTFQNCKSLTSIVIPNSVLYIESGAFESCSNLSTVTLGNSLWGIGYKAFGGCTSLCSLSSMNETPPSDVYGAFEDYTEESANLYVPEGSVEAYKSAPVWSNFLNISEMAGIDSIKKDFEDAEIEVFLFNGIRLFKGNFSDLKLNKGLYIIRNSKFAKSIAIK